MRIILDECVNPRVRSLLEPKFDVSTVRELGWGGTSDNILLTRLQGRCDAFLTIDQGFEHEHNLASLEFGIIIVHVTRNRMSCFKSLQEKIGVALSSAKPGQVLHVS